MKKYEVKFDGGESRDTYNGEIIGVDYMLVEVPDLDDEDAVSYTHLIIPE